MKSALLISALTLLAFSPLSLRAESSFGALKTADIDVPVAAPSKVGVMENYDPAVGGSLAAVAEKRNSGAWKGKCYNYVAWAMHYAGILDFNSWVAMGIEPGYSADAADFAVWAGKNEEKMRRELKLAILPTPENKDEVPLGSILVYDRGWCGFSSASGHIEVLTGPNKACSDNCEGLDQNCFADPSIREHVHVYIPVK